MAQIDFAPFSEEVLAMKASLAGIEQVFKEKQAEIERERDELHAQREDIDRSLEVLTARLNVYDEKVLHLRRALRALGDDDE